MRDRFQLRGIVAHLRQSRAWYLYKVSFWLVLSGLIVAGCAPATPLERAVSNVNYQGAEPDDALLRMGKGQIVGMDLAPDGRYLAVGTTTGLIIYDALTLEQQWQVESLAPVTAFTFDSTSLSMIAVIDGELTARKVLNGRLEQRLIYNEGADRLTRSGEGGAVIAYVAGDLVAGWTLPSLDRLSDLPLLDAQVVEPEAVVNADGSQLATIIDETQIELADATNGERQFLLDAHTNAIGQLMFAPAGDLLYAASPLLLTLWDTQTGELIAADDSFTQPIEAMAVSAGASSVAMLTADGMITRWDGIAVEPTSRFFGLSEAITDIAFTLDNQSIATTNEEGELIIWRVDPPEALRTFEVEGSLNAVAFGRAGTLVAAAAQSGEVFMWRESDPTVPTVFQVSDASATTVAFSTAETLADTLIASGNEDGTVAIWPINDPDDSFELSEHTERVHTVLFSPDGETLLTAGADSQILLHDVAERNVRQRLLLDGLATAAISPDGLWVAAGTNDGQLALWSLADPQRPQMFEAHSAEMVDISFTQDSMFIVTASHDGSVILWLFDELKNNE